ncbi:MAG: hypothetical protein RR835_02710 [Peptostreptococcaceae bacterium]
MDIKYIGLLIIFIAIAILLIRPIIRKLVSKKNIKSNLFILKKNIFLGLYTKLTKVPGIGQPIVNIKEKIYLNTSEDDDILRYKAAMYYLISWLVSIILIVTVVSIYSKDYYTIGVAIIMAFYIKGLIIRLLIGDDTSVLEALIEFIRDIKHKYHEVNNIDESFIYGKEKADPCMINHSKKMIKAIEDESQLEEYNKECLNKHFKIVAQCSFLTKEFGDKKVDNKSLFVKNSNYIIEEIKSEIFKRDNLKYGLKALATLSVIPIFFIPPIESFMMKNFPQSEMFYQSSLGVVSRILILIIAFLGFVTIKKLETINSYNPNTVKESKWEDRLLKIKFIRKLVNYIKPKKDTIKYHKTIKLIQDSGSFIKFEWIYVRKIISCLLAFILLIGLFITIHKTNIDSILKNSSYKFRTEVVTIDGIQQDISKHDEEILKEVNPKDEDVINKVTNKLKEQGITDSKILKESAERIMNKLEAMDNEYLRWYEILATILLSYLASYIPLLILKTQKVLRTVDMQDEVFQFDTIILLLMNHSNVSVEMTLEWMERFSNVFKAPIKECLTNIQGGVVESLENMKGKILYKPLERIIDNLIISDNISIAKAFDSLETERDFYKDERKEENRRLVDERVEWGGIIGLIPFYVTLGLYLAIPMVLTATIELLKMANIMNNL